MTQGDKMFQYLTVPLSCRLMSKPKVNSLWCATLSMGVLCLTSHSLTVKSYEHETKALLVCGSHFNKNITYIIQPPLCGIAVYLYVSNGFWMSRYVQQWMIKLTNIPSSGSHKWQYSHKKLNLVTLCSHQLHQWTTWTLRICSNHMQGFLTGGH